MRFGGWRGVVSFTQLVCGYRGVMNILFVRLPRAVVGMAMGGDYDGLRGN